MTLKPLKVMYRFACRERARRRNCELDRGELSVVRLSPAKAKQRAVSLVRSPRPPPTLELDTVLEERSDPEQTTLSQVIPTIAKFVIHFTSSIQAYLILFASLFLIKI